MRVPRYVDEEKVVPAVLVDVARSRRPVADPAGHPEAGARSGCLRAGAPEEDGRRVAAPEHVVATVAIHVAGRLGDDTGDPKAAALRCGEAYGFRPDAAEQQKAVRRIPTVALKVRDQQIGLSVAVHIAGTINESGPRKARSESGPDDLGLRIPGYLKLEPIRPS